MKRKIFNILMKLYLMLNVMIVIVTATWIFVIFMLSFTLKEAALSQILSNIFDEF